MKNLKTNISKYQTFLIPLFILVLSLFFRFYKLGTLPKAFFGDEAALGYNAWSILETGKDEYGKLFPITFRSFDDYKPGVYVYLTVPFVALFGLNQATSRAAAALAGSLLPVVLYLFLLKISKKQGESRSERGCPGAKSFSFFAALTLALSPWHIEISRTAIEAGVAVFLTMLALYFLLFKKKKFNFLSIILTLTVLFTYHTARIIAPLMLLSFIVLKLVKVKKTNLIVFILIAVFGLFLAATASQERFSQISVFSDQGSKLLREESIREDGGPVNVSLFETRVMHNKVWSIVISFANSYLTNTSLRYLFLGGAQPPRVTIPETGQFLLFSLPFFLFGLVVSFKRFNNFDKWLLFVLLLAPLPASLTTAEIPHTYRTLFLLVPISVYIGLGIDQFLTYFKESQKKIYLPVLLILVLALAVNFSRTWHQYRVHQQVHQPWYRQYGYEDLITYLNSIDNKEKITITNRENEPYIFVLFYNKIDPKVYQQWPQKRLGHTSIDQGGDKWTMFEYTFSEEACPHSDDDHNPNNLYVAHFTCDLPTGYERIKAINFLDGNPEFYVDRPLAIKDSIKPAR